jgi:hypothetical protein
MSRKLMSHVALYRDALRVGCPICEARRGRACIAVEPRCNPPWRRRVNPHTARIYAAGIKERRTQITSQDADREGR